MSTTLVQMKFRKQTIERVERLKARLGKDNRTEVVTGAIHLADSLADIQGRGGRLCVEWPDGRKETLLLLLI